MASISSSDGNMDMPHEWANDEEMAYFFAPLPDNRAADPEVWDHKLVWWRTLIFSIMTKGGISWTLADLQRRLTRKRETPAILERVIMELITSGDLMDTKTFLTTATPAATGGFRLNPLALLQWLSPARPTRPSHVATTTKLAVISHVHHGAQQLHTSLVNDANSALDLIVPWQHIQRQGKKLCHDSRVDEELEILMRQLVIDGAATECKPTNATISSSSSSGSSTDASRVFKLAKRRGTKVDAVTTADYAIGHLKATIIRLQSRLNTIDTKIASKVAEARAAAGRQDKRRAMLALAAKKRLTTLSERMSGALHNVEVTLDSIETLDFNKQIVEVMTAGNDALTALQAKAPSMEEVDRVMATLDDNINQVAESDAIMSKPIAATSLGADEDAILEAELAALEASTSTVASPVKDIPTATITSPSIERKIPVTMAPVTPSTATTTNSTSVKGSMTPTTPASPVTSLSLALSSTTLSTPTRPTTATTNATSVVASNSPSFSEPPTVQIVKQQQRTPVVL